ncbi:MAG: 4,5-DOPA dioxygenase extradiol [Patescibacteria group bacterium]
MSKSIMPAIFIGHGSPMNAIEDNIYTQAWQELGKTLPRPKAILCISAHWYTDKTAVSDSEKPKQIYDFYGFPDELYEVNYPVTGSPELAKTVKELLVPLTTIEYDNSWGIDHGAWVPLKNIFPEANIPTVQLSINYNQPAEFHYLLGQALKPLRQQGVMIICSGNIVHNLGLMSFEDNKPYSWATDFDNLVWKLLNKPDYNQLVDFKSLGKEYNLAIPTPDHYLPFLYFLGLQENNEKLTSFIDGLVYKSISMRSLILQ